jgi:hypothetical protein
MYYYLRSDFLAEKKSVKEAFKEVRLYAMI